MWKGVAVVSVLIGLGGCGGSNGKTDNKPPGADPFVEGSRLKARWIQAPGTPRHLVGWYDTQLQTNCSFRGAYYTNILQEGGGDFYCMPQTTSGAGDVFADAACTQLVADVGCGDIHYVELPSLNRTCDALDRFFAVGEALTSGPVYAKNGSGSCAALDATDPQAPRSPHKLGPELPIGTFVSARLDGGGTGGRIVPRSLKATDGSVEVWGAWDSARGEDVFAFDWPNVAAGYGGATPGHWEPGRISGSGSGLFSDATCTQDVAAFEGCGAIGLKSLADTMTSTCQGYQVTYREAGAPLVASQVFESDGVTCHAYDASAAPANEQLFPLGAQIPASTFVGVQSVERGSDRVRLRAPGTDAGPISTREAFFFDTQRGAPCAAVLAADGMLRCLPVPQIGLQFADAACSRPVLARGSAPTGGCPAEPLPSVVGSASVSSSGACDPTYQWHMYPVGGVHSGTIYMGGSTPADCQPLPADPMLMVYDLGAELPPTDFVQFDTSNPF